MKPAVALNHNPDDYVAPEVTEEDESAQREQLLAGLDGFGLKLRDLRSEAIDGRSSTGIEEQWDGDDDYYEGKDETNRVKLSAWGSKPLGQGGIPEAQAFGSRMFPNITRPYVDAAAARTSDILQPVGDELSWAIKRTPIPDLIDIVAGKMPNSIMASMQGLAPEQQQQAMQMVAQQAQEKIKLADESAEKAQKQIADWLAECQFQDQNRKKREDMCRLGTGILKGPIPAVRKVTAYKDGQLIINEDVKPISLAVNPRNCYPDPACGEDIQNGSYHWERDDITYRKLSDLKGTPGYIDEQIDKCLAEKAFEACKITDNSRDGLIVRSNKYLFEIWHFYGMADKEDLITALNLTRPDDLEQRLEKINTEYDEKVYVQLSMVNNHVIKMVLNPLDTGEFPYDYSVWQRIKDSPWGIGVARQVRVAQDVVKAGWRNLMDNGGIASGPQVIVNLEYVRPYDNIMEFVPWKLWEAVKTLEGTQRMEDVFRFVTTPMYQVEMQNIIEMGNRLAEDSTGLPLIMQGQTSGETPDTLGGLQLQNQNASTVLRRVGRSEDSIMERHIRRYYNFLLQYGEDDSAKGEFVIQAMGSSARVEMQMNNQTLITLFPMSKDPTTRLDPTKMASEIVKSFNVDPARIQYDDPQWEEINKKLAEQANAGPQDTSIQVAQIKEQGATQRKADELASKENTVERQLQAQDAQQRREQEFLVLMQQYDQDVTAYTEGMAKGINDDKLKVKLAETTAKIKAMYDLAAVKSPGEPSPQGPAEPPQKAPPGQSFSQ